FIIAFREFIFLLFLGHRNLYLCKKIYVLTNSIVLWHENASKTLTQQANFGLWKKHVKRLDSEFVLDCGAGRFVFCGRSPVQAPYGQIIPQFCPFPWQKGMWILP
ncbi:MAG: hypothetical protein AAFX53_00570, partial [Bacteroidota bacterium]